MAFRHSAAEIQRHKGGRFLVLRGGEPGGDIQSAINSYYYWDNLFLFGEIDKLFTANDISALYFACELAKRNTYLIFDPEQIGLKNHSGQKIYTSVRHILDNHPSLFNKVLSREDGYNGVIYELAFEAFQTSPCE